MSCVLCCICTRHTLQDITPAHVTGCGSYKLCVCSYVCTSLFPSIMWCSTEGQRGYVIRIQPTAFSQLTHQWRTRTSCCLCVYPSSLFCGRLDSKRERSPWKQASYAIRWGNLALCMHILWVVVAMTGKSPHLPWRQHSLPLTVYCTHVRRLINWKIRTGSWRLGPSVSLP